jgi:hypothetical protein
MMSWTNAELQPLNSLPTSDANGDDGDDCVTHIPPAVSSETLILADRQCLETETSVLWYLQHDTQRWVRLPAPRIPRDHHAMVAAEEKLFIIGGTTHSPFACLSSAEVFSFKLNSWHVLPTKMPTPRESTAAVMSKYDNKIVVIGGLNPLLDGPNGCLASVEQLDLNDWSWSVLPSLKFPRFGCNAVAHENILVVLGGDSVEFGTLSIGEVFCFKSKIWSQLRAPMIHPRSYFGVALHQNKIYVLGGENGHGEVNHSEMFDFETWGWSKLPRVPLHISSGPMGCCSATAMDGKVVVCSDTLVVVFDVASQLWTELPNHRQRMRVPGCVTLTSSVG